MLVGLDDDTVVLGFESQSPLQVWSLATGAKVRDFEESGYLTRSMITLPMRRLAVGWASPRSHTVSVYDSLVGKKLQDLPGFGGAVNGLAYVNEHIVTASADQRLQVWGLAPSGMV